MYEDGRSQRPRRATGRTLLRVDPVYPRWEEVMFGKSKLAFALVLALSAPAFAADTPGVTATEIKVGGIFPFSGPASSIGLVGRGILAYVQSINGRGRINGRKVNYIAYDDAY